MLELNRSNMIRYITVLIILVSVFLSMGLNGVVFGQTNITTGNTPPYRSYADAQPWTLQDFINVLTEARNFFLIIGIILIVSFLIWSGVTYLLSGGDEAKITSAKQRLLWTVIGAVVILAVFVIMETIRVVLTQKTFFPESGP